MFKHKAAVGRNMRLWTGGLGSKPIAIVSVSAGAYVPAGLALERSRPSGLRKEKMVELQVGTRKSVVGVAVRAGPIVGCEHGKLTKD